MAEILFQDSKDLQKKMALQLKGSIFAVNQQMDLICKKDFVLESDGDFTPFYIVNTDI